MSFLALERSAASLAIKRGRLYGGVSFAFRCEQPSAGCASEDTGGAGCKGRSIEPKQKTVNNLSLVDESETLLLFLSHAYQPYVCSNPREENERAESSREAGAPRLRSLLLLGGRPGVCAAPASFVMNAFVENRHDSSTTAVRHSHTPKPARTSFLFEPRV